MPNLQKIALAVLIVSIPLYPKFPLGEITGSYVNLRLDDLIVASSLFIWLIYQIKNKFPVRKEPITLLFIAYWAALASSTIGSISNHQVEATKILALHSLRRIEYMLLFFLTISAIKNKKDTTYLFAFLCISCISISIVGLGQKYLNWPIISTMNEEFSKGQLLYMSTWTRISSTFAGHYDLATFMSVVLVIIGPITLLIRNLKYKLLLILTWLSSYYTLTLTASRVSIVAFWVSLTLALFLIKKKIWIIPTSILIAFSIFNSQDLSRRLLATVPNITKQFNSLYKQKAVPTPIPTLTPTPIIATIDDKTNKAVPIAAAPIATPTAVPTPIRIRLDDDKYPEVDADAGVARSGEIRFKVEWPRAINAFIKNPLQGTGPGSITLATDNDYLRTLGETGLVGLICFLLIPFWFTLKTFADRSKTIQHDLNYIFLSSMICMLINAIFIDVFAASKTAYMFWVIMGVYYVNLKFSKDE